MLSKNFISAQIQRLQVLFSPKRFVTASVLLALTAGINTAQAIPAQSPLYLMQAVTPIMMLNMSKDHQLYFKAYDDYTDLTDTHVFSADGVTPNPNFLKPTGDGVVTKLIAGTVVDETTYMHGYEYYGYFDSKKCYTYTNNQFEPAGSTDSDGYCSNKWNGNFLNWGTMTRMDVIRKILYGGLRSTDTNTETVLERAFLPTDAHAFAKYYNGNDINKLTPISATVSNVREENGITLCNVSREANSGYSEASTQPPLIRVATGNYSLWASNERFQCRWMATSTILPGINKNSNNASQSGVDAYEQAPTKGSSQDKGEFVARVKVCTSGAVEDNCQKYPSANYPNKPIGLLQKYGETDELHFGLITGSFGRNKSGGVLRKNAGNMRDEINTAAYGTFISSPANGGIINTINKLRLFGYDYNYGGYEGTYHSRDSCTNKLTSFYDGDCSNWGNPQSEIYYESLRYLAGKSATTEYAWPSNPDTNYISGLTIASWSAPVTKAKGNYCAPLSILQFNASSSSYDDSISSNYPNLSGVGLTGINQLNTFTDAIGSLEGIQGTTRFVGKINGSGDQLCTAKNVSSLSAVSGICPDSPRLDGGYTVAGLARYARKEGIPLANFTPAVTSKVRTYGVALAPAVPKVEIRVPGTSNQKVIIQPACRNQSTNPATNCAIVDFKIVAYTEGYKSTEYGEVSGTFGKLYVNWEDSEQGFDYDQDMWGLITYFVSSTGKVFITTQVFAQSGGDKLGFGYVLSGTNSDGFKVHSGANSFEYPVGSGQIFKCRRDNQNNFGPCDENAAPKSTREYTVAAPSALSGTFMESPLYYAAKWGGYDSDFERKNSATLDAAVKARTPNDSFFFATNPKALADQLAVAFESIKNDVTPSSGVATSNPRLSNDAFLFQTKFNTATWTGEVQALQFDANGVLKRDSDNEAIVQTSTVDNGKMPTTGVGRKVYTNVIQDITPNIYSTAPAAVPLLWSSLNTTQRALLKHSSDGSNTALAQNRVNWLLGNNTYEVGQTGGVFRSRTFTSTANGPQRNILGDMVNSKPVYVGAEDNNYERLPKGGSSYLAYVKEKKNKNTPLIFIGANDGMVHAFNASYTVDAQVASTPDLLKEVFAYIPQIAFENGKLAKLTQADYGKSSNPHQYIVDGPIVASDVYIKDKWRTVIVGTLGAGGRGVYALDVTDTLSDKSFNTPPKVLFEISNTTCSVATVPCPAGKEYYPQLGYVMGAPVIAPMTNGRFAVIFGNGDTAGTLSPQLSHLFVIDLEAPFNPAYSRAIPTGTTLANAGTGLSAPEVLPNSVGQAIGAYAGDLSGNLWHFNLSGATGNVLTANETPSPANWRKDYLLFTATPTVTDNVVPANNIQPIFAAPTIGFNLKNNKYMVYFGTGKYYDTGDNSAVTKPVHSIYAIADMSVNGELASPVPRDKLKAKSFQDLDTRTEHSGSQPDWSIGKDQGWYLDLPATGERITTTPLLIDDKLVFPTLIPQSDQCVIGGNSWLMELVATGALTFTHKTVLDKNVFSEGLILGNLSSGRRGDGNGSALGSRTSGKIVEDKLNLEPGTVGRQSWRQLR